MPNETERRQRVLEYDESTHSYTLDGRRVPSVTEIVSLLTAGKYGADTNPAMLEQAKRRGTAVHELCEAIDCGVDPEELEIAPELVGYINAYLAFLRDYRPTWTHIEKAVYSDEFAGRIDRLGEIAGQVAVVDIKTTANMDRLSKLALLFQLHGYSEAASVSLGIYPRLRIGVQLKRDGSYTVHYASKIYEKYLYPFGEEMDSLFRALLKITKIMGGYQ